MSAINYEKLVTEDLNRGYGDVDVTMPAGGTATGSKVGIHSFLDRWRNVIDFGAAVNGTTPDQDAIQAAIDSLTDGGVVVLPAGDYALSGTITFGALEGITILLDPGVTFSGAGSLPTTTGLNRIVDLGAMNLDRVQENTVLGYQAGQDLTSGSQNVVIGPYAGRELTTQTGNTFIGDRAGLNNRASNNTFVGSTTGQSNTTGDGNTFVGRTGNQNTTGQFNTFLGFLAGDRNTTGANDTCVGVNAGASNIDGYSLTFVGYNAGVRNISGVSNTFVGTQAGASNLNSSFNCYYGSFCAAVETGQANAYYGYKAGFESTAGDRNTYLGNSAAEHFTTGTDNVVVGYDAGHGVACTGGGNVLVGPTATVSATTSTSATAIGNAAIAGTTGVAIGVSTVASYAKSVALGANAQTGRASAVILGDASDSEVRVGVGTASPHDCAILELNSNSASPKGLLLPRLSTTQRDSLTATIGAGYGFLIWTVGVGLQTYDGSGWKTVTVT